MHPVLKQISDIGIVPVIAIDDAEKAVPQKALVAGGCRWPKVTFRTAMGGAIQSHQPGGPGNAGGA